MTRAPSEMPESARAAAVGALPERIAFLGLGLIGGSVALALREAGCTAHFVAWTPSGTRPAVALRRGLIDEVAATAKAAIEGAGLVILAGPPRSILETLLDLAAEFRAAAAGGATITDVASTKGLIGATAEDLHLPFVGGHPMAGRESTGLEAASADLFVDRPWVVVPTDGASKADLDRVEALATATGARPVRMTAIDHDIAVSAISHLPLIAAAALVESVASGQTWGTARGLAAGGWRDMTRLARGDELMGADIIATNARPIAAQLRAYRAAIDGWLSELDALIEKGTPAEPDVASVSRLRGRLQAVRAELERAPGG